MSARTPIQRDATPRLKSVSANRPASVSTSGSYCTARMSMLNVANRGRKEGGSWSSTGTRAVTTDQRCQLTRRHQVPRTRKSLFTYPRRSSRTAQTAEIQLNSICRCHMRPSIAYRWHKHVSRPQQRVRRYILTTDEQFEHSPVVFLTLLSQSLRPYSDLPVAGTLFRRMT